MDAITLFEHQYIARSEGNGATLLLLHGTGGNEYDLLQLGAALDPSANLLSPRGKVLENGLPRFFRRLAEGVFDEEDILRQSYDLNEFIKAAAGRYGFDRSRVTAVGYSNGANIAVSLLLLHPGTLASAVLFHAMVPLEPPELPALENLRVFLGAGESDPMIPPSKTAELVRLLQRTGADLTVHWESTGHGLNRNEVEAAASWLLEIA